MEIPNRRLTSAMTAAGVDAILDSLIQNLDEVEHVFIPDGPDRGIELYPYRAVVDYLKKHKSGGV
jgi:hypothetical protein